MARHDDHEKIGRGGRGLDGLHQERLLAIAGASDDPDSAPGAQQCTQLAALRVDVFRNREVELDVAGDRHVAGAERFEPGGILRRLRGDAGEMAERFAGEPGHAGIAGSRARGKPRIHQEDGNAADVAFEEEVGPDLGLEKHPEGRLRALEEAAYGETVIPRKPRLRHLVSKDFAARGTPGRRHVREEDRNAGVVAPERGDERGGSTGFTDGYRVHPDDGAAAGNRDGAEALAEVLQVARLAAGAPREARQHDGQGEPEEDAVGEAGHQAGDAGPRRTRTT